MNTASIYSDATRSYIKQEELDKVKNEKDIALQVIDSNNKLNHHEWLNAPHTKLVLSNLVDLKNDLIEKSIALAISYPTHNNHQLIVKALTQAATINDILNTYGKRNNSE